MMSQFRYALQQGLHGQLAPLVKRQQIINCPLTPFYHTYPDDKDESNWSYNTADREYLVANEKKVDDWQSAVADWEANWDEKGVEKWNEGVAVDWEEKGIEGYEPPSSPIWPKPESKPKDEYEMTDELKEAVATLEDQLSSPPLVNVFSDPTIQPPPLIPTCGVCGSSAHHTPDCATYVCFHCEVPQAGHYPADCPDLEEYFDTTD